MAKFNEKDRRFKTIRKTSYSANAFYLALHLVYFILFLIAKLYVMVYVTLGIIVLYALFFFLIRAKKYFLFTIICGNEFLAFIIFASIILGFETGFHLLLIGLSVVSFFTTYFAKKTSAIESYIWVGLSSIIYVALVLVDHFNAPIFSIDSWLETTLMILHVTIVFVIITAFLTVFLKYATSLEKKIVNESRTDELTQISNRYGLYDFYEDIKDKSNTVLALFDIDDFKNINDTYGHVAGDYVLKTVAQLADNVIDDSFVCRYGGEEFVIMIEDDMSEGYFKRLEAFRKIIENQEFEFEKMKTHLTVTIGAVKYIDKIDLTKWVELADEKMYKGKNSGKNKTVI